MRSPLRTWFIIHCVVDLAFAIPLFVAPEAALGLFGWTTVDPIATRLVAAALFGIGLQSFFGRNEPAEVFRAMLNLKLVWSALASLGILVSMPQGAPAVGWVLFAIFMAFNVLWAYFRFRRPFRV